MMKREKTVVLDRSHLPFGTVILTDAVKRSFSVTGRVFHAAKNCI